MTLRRLERQTRPKAIAESDEVNKTDRSIATDITEHSEEGISRFVT